MWRSPIPLHLRPTSDAESFRTMEEGETGIPTGNHPGAFGFRRKNHVHEGVDLYCDEGTAVSAVEAGTIVAIIDFTGGDAVPPSPWWRPTQAVLVEGASGVVVYGEVGLDTGVRVGTVLAAGEAFAHVKRVLRKDKGRPMTMLHLELHRPGTRDALEWTTTTGRPASLLDPTEALLEVALDMAIPHF